MKNRYNTEADREAGFTLIEVMIALAILGMVLTGVVQMFVSTGGYHTSQEQQMEVTQNIRAIKLMMVDELRSAACDPYFMPLSTIGFQLNNNDDTLNTDANSIHFTRDIDNGDGDQFYEPDGDSNDPNEDISYFRTNDSCDIGQPAGALLNANDNTPGCLRRETTGGGMAVAANITNLAFRYFDAANTELINTQISQAELALIRLVEVTITGQVQNTARVTAANRTWTQVFQVRVRNL